ncbi:helix-turn-helix domain-containing protein [Cyclobacterium plantarum]|uniref:Helix-turn-helix transcriptional regulator n=1 Tax=Cyclobacterium plantarum TaxID=2716263 RepID=A0ABX0H735_9BACT|nr:helix-turn-helix domain-containing protein [Cyclobacterium plantarum]NHE56306.1 helix-turn-helix transcriptional regulator [Cyclobacterium plantarum]
MEIPVVYIGFAQATFIAIMMFWKKPLKIADVILAVFMVCIAWMFALNIAQEVKGVTQQTWYYSIPISLTYPAFLYLYSKYVSVDFGRFQRKDYFHSIPFFASFVLIFLFKNPDIESFYFDLEYYGQLNWLRNSLGSIFILLLWIYGILAIRNIRHYRKQRSDLYSFKSDLNSLNWLLVFVISFMVVQNFIILATTLFETGYIQFDIKPLVNVSLLVFVYIAGFWGFRQNQLSSALNSEKEFLHRRENKAGILSSEKYQKSGLKNEQANAYLIQLTRFMEETLAWKDNELSIAKISEQTRIPKHYITQVLNEHLGKNFYSFVNEYRIAEAKEMIASPKYQAWSFVAIAYECGFNSKTAFNNFFKKITGLTPSEYRNTASN